MIGIQIKDGFLDFAKTDFECPHCKSKYNDADDKYLKRCEKNKSMTTKINCKCGKPFFMTYDYTGDAVSFIQWQVTPIQINKSNNNEKLQRRIRNNSKRFAKTKCRSKNKRE